MGVKSMPNEDVVNIDLTSQNQEVSGQGGSDTTPKVGDKTEPNLLLKSLQEERERRRLAEEEAALLKKENEELKTTPAFSGDDQFSDEGRALKKEISAAKAEIDQVKTDLSKKEIMIDYPVLKDKWDDFESYRSSPENKGMNLRTAAKAYLVENGFTESAPRKGLENPTGGDKSAPTAEGMTAEEVKNLRLNDYKKYIEMVQKGQLKIK